MKLGEQGSLLCVPDRRQCFRVPVFPARVVDTTGAGDSYCGGFLAGLAEGRPFEVCAAMGTVAASYVVEACGALNTAIPDKAERDARLARVMEASRLLESALSGNLRGIDSPAFRFHPLPRPDQWQWQGSLTLDDFRDGENVYLRMRQANGQSSWTSPIFCRA